MKIEYKLLIKINPNDTYITLEYNEEQKVLEEKQKILTTMFPNWQEVLIVKEELSKHLPKVKDKVTKIKLTEAIKQIVNLTKGRVVEEKQVLTMMRYYELVKEIKNVHLKK